MVPVGFLASFAAVAVMYAFRVELKELVAGWAMGIEPNLILLNIQNLFS